MMSPQLSPPDVWFLTYTLVLATATLMTSALSIGGHLTQWTCNWRLDEPHYHILFILVSPPVTRLLHSVNGLLWWFITWANNDDKNSIIGLRQSLYTQYICDVADWFSLYHYSCLLCYYFYRQASVALESTYPFHHRDKCQVNAHYVATRLSHMFHQQCRKRGLSFSSSDSTSLSLIDITRVILWCFLAWRIGCLFVAVIVLENFAGDVNTSIAVKTMTTKIARLIWLQRLVDTGLLALVLSLVATQLYVVHEHCHRYMPAKKLITLTCTLFALGLESFLLVPSMEEKTTKHVYMLHYNTVSLTLCVNALVNYLLYPPTELRQCVAGFDMRYETNSPVPLLLTSKNDDRDTVYSCGGYGSSALDDQSSDTDQSLMVRFSSDDDDDDENRREEI